MWNDTTAKDVKILNKQNDQRKKFLNSFHFKLNMSKQHADQLVKIFVMFNHLEATDFLNSFCVANSSVIYVIMLLRFFTTKIFLSKFYINIYV